MTGIGWPRQLLFLVGILAAGSAGCRERPSAEPPEGALAAPSSAEGVFRTVRQLADGIYTYEYAAAGDPVTTVSMFVVTDGGVLVADGQGSPDETRRLLAAIAEVTDQPVTHVVICSDHGDHTGGNVVFPTGTAFLGHPATRRALAAAAVRPERGLDAPPVMLPTETVTERAVVRLGGKQIDVLFLGRGHTAGDLVVHVPEDRILFMSEAYNDRVFPLMRSGYPSEWVEVLEKAEAMEVDTYVAGHGVRGSIEYGRDALGRYRAATEQVIAEATRLHSAGLTAEEAALQARFDELAGWADYSSQSARAIQRVFMELNGELPPG